MFGKWHAPRDVGKEACCHRQCLHESGKIQNAHPEGSNLEQWRDKKKSKSSWLPFLEVHYIVLQYILIASLASPGKLRAESLFTPPLQRLKHL